jgi:uncharacterized membrane protein YkvA (DUF1232 family)
MENNRNIISSQDRSFFQDLILRLRLILRLMGDKRVNFFLKLLPIVATIYVLSPIDLIPAAVVPLIGALDDAAVIWLGTTLFVSLCPNEVVREHTKALQKVVNGIWQDISKPYDQGEIIDVKPKDDNQDPQVV